MSKKSRGFQPPTGGAGSGVPSSPVGSTGQGGQPTSAGRPGDGGSSSSAPGSSRAAARRAAATGRSVPQQSFVQRYQTALLLGATAVGVGLVALFFLQSASAAPYRCLATLTPGPSAPIPTVRPATPSPAPSVSPTSTESGAPPSPAPSGSSAPSASPTPAPTPEPQPTQQLGFPTTDLGTRHVDPATTVEYAYCPPTSGEHFNVQGEAPLPRRFYGPEVSLRPGDWIHNLEHGYVVFLYKGTPPAATLDSIRAAMEAAEPSAPEIAQNCALPNKVIAVRFDDMDADFAALAWDRALLMDTWDPQLAMTFAQQWQDSPQAPESRC